MQFNWSIRGQYESFENVFRNVGMSAVKKIQGRF